MALSCLILSLSIWERRGERRGERGKGGTGRRKRKRRKRRSKHRALHQRSRLDKNKRHILTLSCCFPVTLLSILPISSTSPYTALTTSATRGAAVDTSAKQQGRVKSILVARPTPFSQFALTILHWRELKMEEVWEHYNYKHTMVTSGGHREDGGGNKNMD